MSNEQTIRRSKHKRDFLTVHNSLSQNRDLSYEARGMLVELLSRPDDWEVSITQLEMDGCKRDKVRRILSELVTAGYVTGHEKNRDSEGKIYYTPYIVFDYPQSTTEKPSAVEPSAVKPTQQSTEVQSTEVQKKTLSAVADASQDTDNEADAKPVFVWDGWITTIGQIFKVNAPRAANILHMLRGTVSDKRKHTEYYKHQLKDEPFTDSFQIQAFGAWYRRTYPGIDMPLSPEAIATHVYRWRQDTHKRLAAPKHTAPVVTQPDVSTDDIQEALRLSKEARSAWQ